MHAKPPLPREGQPQRLHTSRAVALWSAWEAHNARAPQTRAAASPDAPVAEDVVPADGFDAIAAADKEDKHKDYAVAEPLL